MSVILMSSFPFECLKLLSVVLMNSPGVQNCISNIHLSGVNKSARERIGRQNFSQKVPSKKGFLGVIFSPRTCRENAHSKSADFEGRHSGGHLLGQPLFFPSDKKNLAVTTSGKNHCGTFRSSPPQTPRKVNGQAW